MKAPNGKNSNLTPEQYKLVRTPAFKKWFGDWENSPETSSKVVDENGEPLVVYHGTKKVFTKFFEKKYLGSEWDALNFFTTNYYTALSDYDGWITYPCFIKIINPLKKLSWTPERSIGEEIIAGLKTDGFIFSGAALQKPLADRETWIAVSKSNQIKLADKPIIKSTLKNKKFIEKVNTTFTKSNTTFDANNPDIRYEDGGALNDEKYKLFREEFFTHLIAGKLGNIKGFSEKNGNKDINDLAIEISLLNQQHKAYEKGRDIIGKLYLLAKKIDENTGLKTSKGITYNYIIKRDIFSIKELYDKIDEEALPLFNELADESNTTFDANNPDIRYSKGGGLKDELAIVIKGVTNENKYKGNYKKIFDLIEKDIVFYSPYGTTSEELKGNDFYITIMPRPESSIIDEISKLKNVEIQNYFKLGGQIKYFEYTIGGL